MSTAKPTPASLGGDALDYVQATPWSGASWDPLTGDASTRRYYRLRQGGQTAILMDASQGLGSVKAFFEMAGHLRGLGFSAPEIYHSDLGRGFMILEDFGDATFTSLLESGQRREELYGLATDLLAALHQNPQAIPRGLREYDPERMLADIGLLLEWHDPPLSEKAREEFRQLWSEVLPLAHHVPRSFLHRDYHVANLMLLAGRAGLQRVGLLDFQDAYQGPVAYDLVSLLEDARREVPDDLRERMMARYLEQFPRLNRSAFSISTAILAAVRHTRVLAIFERLSKFEGKHEYKQRYSPRVWALLERALRHPALSCVRQWFDRYGK